MTATNKCYNFVGFRCRVPLISLVILSMSRTSCCCPEVSLASNAPLLEAFSHCIDSTVKLLKQVIHADDPSGYKVCCPDNAIAKR